MALYAQDIIRAMKTDVITLYDCDACQGLNAELAAAIQALPEEAFARRTHLFHGRYENLYIEAGQLPGLTAILAAGLAKAAEILGRNSDKLKMGFWLNIMRRGDVTTLHRHDDDDELLSAVYYVQANEGSARFRLQEQGEVHEVIPVSGRFMFFDPALPHEVLTHELESPRISIGINFGPADQD